METYKFELEFGTMLVNCKSLSQALATAQEMDVRLIGLATKDDLNSDCNICLFNYDFMNLDKCPNCGN